MKKMLIIMAFLFLGVSITYAQSLNTLSDTVTRHRPSIASDHLIKFKTSLGIGNSTESLTLTFDSGFDLTSILISDISLSHGVITGTETSELLSAFADTINWGISILGQNITFTHPTNNSNGDIAASDFIVIKIGLNAGGANQIVNPVSLGSKIIRLSTSLGEIGALAVPVMQDQVGVNSLIDGNITLTVVWAVPELRVGSLSSNDDIKFYLTVRTPVNTDDIILYTQPIIVDSNLDSSYNTPISVPTISPGIYDIGIKTQQHLTRVLDNVLLTSGNNGLNFSQLDFNIFTRGDRRLLAGDINNTGLTPVTLGDDVVNSVDLSQFLTVLDEDDLTGNILRANLNQDVVINSVDLSMMIKNLDAEGDN